MMSPPTAQEGTISRRLEHKSFGYKPLESKTRFITLSDGKVTGLFSERSGPGRCPGSGRWPISRGSATHSNPAWRPKQPSIRAPYCSNPAPDRPAGRAGASPESPRSTPDPQTTTNMLSLIPKMGNRTVGCAKRPLFPAESGNKLISDPGSEVIRGVSGEAPVGLAG
jgi:hypothetical protein